MNTKKLKYVQVLASEGSFSKAADVLNISQPSLSQYIRKIENQLGIDLFDRTNGCVKLTDAGEIYIQTGRKILEIEHHMEEQFTDLMYYKTGSFIIGTAPYRAASMMPVIASEFKKSYPGIHLVIREGTTSELEEKMLQGEYDLCLTLSPVDARFFNYEKVVEEELLLAVPATFPQFSSVNDAEQKYPSIDIAQLNEQSMVQLTDTQFMQQQLETLVVNHKLSIKTAAVVKSLEAQIEMVKAGVGSALVPSGIERFCSNQEVVFYSFVQKFPKRKVIIVWRKDRQLSKVAEELKNIILDIDW